LSATVDISEKLAFWIPDECRRNETQPVTIQTSGIKFFMGHIQKVIELTPEEMQALKSFVRDGLGCGCPDEVFSFIQVKINPGVFHGLPIDYLVTIGDRLLVGICLSESLDDGIGKNIKKSLAVGKQLRDRAGFNRFRLVITSEKADSIAETIQKQFNGLTGLDDRVHLHVVRLSMLPKFLARAEVY
jgi:hypothetical protein